jgi:hypothetical protein
MGGLSVGSGGREGAARGPTGSCAVASASRTVSTAVCGSSGTAKAVWQTAVDLQGVSALPLVPGAWSWWSAMPAPWAICAIIGQSGGQGLQGFEAALAGAPPTTKMIAASRPRRTRTRCMAC